MSMRSQSGEGGEGARPGTSREPLLVVAALRREVAPLVRRLARRRRPAGGTASLVAGELHGRPLLVAVTGDGAAAAEHGLEAIVTRHPVAGVLGVGVAGGLSPGLAPGELVVAEAVRDPERGETYLPEGGPRAPGGRAEAPGRPALLLSHPSIVSAAAAKAALWRELGAPAAAVVDLESAAWVRVARRHGLPWAVLRAVSDPAEESLPLDFERFRVAGGRVSTARVLAAALARPSRLAGLWLLRGRVALCASRLADAVERSLDR